METNLKISTHDKQRTVIDFFNNNDTLCFRLGRVNYQKASAPLTEHSHAGMVEVVYIDKGKQIYTINNKNYVVNSGEVFVALPDELHSSSNFPEDKSLIYYLIINLHSDNLGIGYDNDDKNLICKSIYEIKQRVFKVDPSIKLLLELIIDACYMECNFKNTIIRNKISELVLAIVNYSMAQQNNNLSSLQKVINFIVNHVNDDLGVIELASISGLSVSRFKSKFREQIGIPPREYVLRKKIEAAKLLLCTTDKSITEIAFELGFSTSQYFSTVFKRFEYINPIYYRKIQ